jgi:transposase
MKNEQKRKFLELRAKGNSYDKIARELQVSKQTLINWSKELATDLANLKAIEMEALREEYLMTAQARIELFGKQLKAIMEELEKRDLSEVPTSKLIDMLMKYYKLLQEESRAVTFREDEDTGWSGTHTHTWLG